jgi:hypothetical protein
LKYFDRIPHSANLHEVILAVNKMVDELNTVLTKLDEENLSEALRDKIYKEE